ncbi:hypothetical protein BRC81_12400 [Halobacteriales archaeon QS_1_68_20]|nr:MAG: hypothetical protein BRC81_12400 [Halobacteriales archaeon QS_1_68_20]
MKLEIEIPDKYGDKLSDLEEVEPTIRDQIEVEVLPEVLRIINDGHRQLQENADQFAPDVGEREN